jgi:hypothetical protein
MVTDLLVTGGSAGESSARAHLGLAPVQMLCSKSSEGSRVRERRERTNRESSHRGGKEEKYR